MKAASLMFFLLQVTTTSLSKPVKARVKLSCAQRHRGYANSKMEGEEGEAELLSL